MAPLNPIALLLIVGIFALVVYRQVRRQGPPVWVTFLLGGLLALPLGVLPWASVGPAVGAAIPVVLFLLAMFILVGALDGSGAIEHLARWFAGRARRTEEIPMVLFVGFGLLSMASSTTPWCWSGFRSLSPSPGALSSLPGRSCSPSPSQ